MSMRKPIKLPSRTCRQRQHPYLREKNYGVQQQAASRLLHRPPPQLHYPSPPHLPIQRPHPSCAHVYACTHPNPRASCITLRLGEWCTLAPPPPLPHAQPVRLWGLRGRLRGSRGSDDSGRQCAGTHSQTPMAQHRHSRLETTDADAPNPYTLAEAKHSPEPHHSWHTSMPPPPPLSTDQVPENAVGYPITHGVPSRTRIQSNGQHQCPHRGGPCRSDAASSMARNWHTILGCAFPIDGTTPPLILKAAAHHWERQCHSQPWACPLGDSQADSFHYLPDTPCHGQTTVSLSKS